MFKKTSLTLLSLALTLSLAPDALDAKKKETRLTDSTLKNQTINGDLIIMPSAGKNVTLENVKVTGNTYFQGRAPESLTLRSSSLSALEVDKTSSITATGDTIVSHTELEAGATLTEVDLTNQGFTDVSVSHKKGDVTLAGEFNTVEFSSKEKHAGTTLNGIIDEASFQSATALNVPIDSIVKSLDVEKKAKNSSLHLEGTVQEAALEATINVNGESVSDDSFTSPWTLSWHDEFNSGSIDRSKWTFDLGNGFNDANGNYVPGWGNAESQYYTDRPENARTEDGKLIITAQEEEYEGFNYTSSRLKTKGLFATTYGRFEMKASLPVGAGYWPAFWMLPEDDQYGGWAASGEIDIMEAKGAHPEKVLGTIHYGETWPNNKYSGDEYLFTDGSTIADDHIYAVEWEPGEIRWYVDGELYQTQDNWYSRGLNETEDFDYPAPFDQPFHLLLNVAVGGTFDGEPTEDTLFPQSMDVEYVRVFDLTGRDYKTPVKPVIEAEPLPENAKLAREDGNLVYNSTFTEDEENVQGIEGLPNTDHWYFLALPDFQGQAGITLEQLGNDTFAKINIQQPGVQPYAIQLIQNVTVGKGRYYKLTFDAKTTGTRPINVKISGDANRDYATYSRNETYQLTDQTQTYETTFQMTAETDIAARLEFNLGLSNQPVWIGNIRLVETEQKTD